VVHPQGDEEEAEHAQGPRLAAALAPRADPPPAGGHRREPRRELPGAQRPAEVGPCEIEKDECGEREREEDEGTGGPA
jgi:hypothetical protein